MLKFDKDPKSSSNFLKLADKESVVGILRGEVRDFYMVWEGDESKEVPEGTAKSKFRFRVNIVTILKDGSFDVKVLEQGVQMYKQLKTLSEDYNLEETAIRIVRSGSGKNDTEYTVIPLPKPPEKQTLEKLKTLELLPLTDDELEKVETQKTSEELPPY